MERWIEMTMRHHRERVELVQSLAQSRYTQAEAAKILDISRTNLNNFIQRNGIYWPVIRQGRKSGEQRVTKDSVIDNQSSIDNCNGQQA
jgi:predicted transcriptional regulator